MPGIVPRSVGDGAPSVWECTPRNSISRLHRAAFICAQVGAQNSVLFRRWGIAFFCLQVDMRWIAGVDSFVFELGGVPAYRKRTVVRMEFAMVCGVTFVSVFFRAKNIGRPSVPRPARGALSETWRCQRNAGKIGTAVDSACRIRGQCVVHESRRGAAGRCVGANQKFKNRLFFAGSVSVTSTPGQGGLQQARMKHKKCRVLPSGKKVSDSLCMEDDRMTT